MTEDLSKRKKSGQQIAEENEARFSQWLQERAYQGDWLKYATRSGDKLNRSEIASELSFARSVLSQNPSIKQALISKEQELRDEEVLSLPKSPTPSSVQAENERAQKNLGRSQSRVKALEQQVAALTAERDDLRRRVERLEFLEHHMATNGRVPH